MKENETPLLSRIRDEIGRSGPLSVRDYMAICLGDREHGYYRKRQAIGRRGDFVTAPEISQMFGELIGLWTVVVWQSMGSPVRCRLIELGAGRGTMLVDALRAARVRPEFAAAVSIDIVEQSEVLREEQRQTLASSGHEVYWHEDLAAISADRPAILLANEFIDALPVFQFVRRAEQWNERRVGVTAEGRLEFCDGEPTPEAMQLTSQLQRLGAAPEGSIAELRDLQPLAEGLARFARGSVAGLLIDYGHEGPLTGDTLQAVRAHAYADPLRAPGDADLTAHVDFAGLAEAITRAGLVVEPVITQAEFLGRLGIIERARALARKNPESANPIETAVARLVSPAAMGHRFKALGFRGPTLSPLPGFQSPPPPARR